MPQVYDPRLREAQALIVHAVLDAIEITGGNASNVNVQILIGRSKERLAAILGNDWVEWPPQPVQLELDLV
jgi:hypothetical protein